MEKLKNIRKKRGLKQKDIYEQIGIKQAIYSHYECGRYEMPVKIAKEIAQILNVDWWELYD